LTENSPKKKKKKKKKKFRVKKRHEATGERYMTSSLWV